MKIYLAGPQIFKYKKEMCEKDIERVKRLVGFLESKGNSVFNVHVERNFGKNGWDASDIVAKWALDEMKKSELLIAYPGNPPSGGVHMEIGWASIMDKRIILLLKKDREYSPMIHGLKEIAKVDVVEFETDDEAIEGINKCLEKYNGK